MRTRFRILLVAVASVVFGGAMKSDASSVADGLSSSGTPFRGKISANARDSVADWREPVAAPNDAPNVLLILLDDVGFADTSTFGGLAQTPVLDRLAAHGLRYNRFHTTAVCATTRAALLTGRNHHRVGYGSFGGVGYPSYDGLWKKSTASIAEVLKRNGYSTAAFGKWHNTPYQDISPVGPFERWPTGLGFEYFYGNMLSAASQWEPPLWRNTEMVPPRSKPEEGYHFTTDTTDEAIRWLQTHESLAASKPYFIYFATGAAHFPLHVPKNWIDRYRGRFDQGWDRLRGEIFARQKALGVVPDDAQLTTRPQGIPAWESLSTESKRLYARQMEVYAAFIEHTDHEIGRLIEAVRQGSRGENTLVLFVVGDNGADANPMFMSPELVRQQLPHLDELGGLRFMNLYFPQWYFAGYASGWGWMGNTPFPSAKADAAHLGGTRNPLVVSWSSRLQGKGAVRARFAHVNDIAPTIYEAAGIEPPTTIDGASLKRRSTV